MLAMQHEKETKKLETRNNMKDLSKEIKKAKKLLKKAEAFSDECYSDYLSHASIDGNKKTQYFVRYSASNRDIRALESELRILKAFHTPINKEA